MDSSFKGLLYLYDGWYQTLDSFLQQVPSYITRIDEVEEKKKERNGAGNRSNLLGLVECTSSFQVYATIFLSFFFDKFCLSSVYLDCDSPR